MIDTFVEGVNLKEYTLKGQPYEYKDKIRLHLIIKMILKCLKFCLIDLELMEKEKLLMIIFEKIKNFKNELL